MPSSPGSHDSALPQSQAQQGGAASQPGHSLDPENMPVEKDGSVHTEGNGSPQQGRAAEGTDAQSNLAPSDHAEVKDLSTSTPSVDKGLALGGGPALSAFEGHPKVTEASQKAPLPESKEETSGQEEKVLVSVKQVGGEQQGTGLWGGACFTPCVLWVRCLHPLWDLLPGQGRAGLPLSYSPMAGAY